MSIDLSDVLRSFTSIYQLLPIYPCFDPGDGTLKRTTEAPIPHVDSGKAEAALAFTTRSATPMERNSKDPEYRMTATRIHCVVGNVQPTYQSARRGRRQRRPAPRATRAKTRRATAPCRSVSSTPLEIKDEAGAMYSNERHGSLQNADPVLNQLAGVVTAVQTLRTVASRPSPAPRWRSSSRRPTSTPSRSRSG